MMYIKCQTCGFDYESIFDSPYQGIDCAAHADDKGVEGYYGSTLVDMDYYEWNPIFGKPIHVKEGIICDECIKPLLEDNLLVFSKTLYG